MEHLLMLIVFATVYIAANGLYLAFANAAYPGSKATRQSRLWVSIIAAFSALYWASPWPEIAVIPFVAALFWYTGAAWVEWIRDLYRARTVTSTVTIKFPEQRREAEAA